MALRIRYNSPVILTFSLLATAVFFLFGSPENEVSRSLFVVGNRPFDFGRLTDYFSLVGHTLGHASMEHLMGNLSFILLIGPIIEEKYGSSDTLFMMLATALITGILQILFFPHGLLGASGIVFMLILLVSFTNTTDGGIPLTFILILLLYLGGEVLSAFQENNVSEFAHIIGGLAGSVFGFALGRSHQRAA